MLALAGGLEQCKLGLIHLLDLAECSIGSSYTEGVAHCPAQDQLHREAVSATLGVCIKVRTL
jgi:hypothetical protein